MTFWNNDCNHLAQKLWIPSLLIDHKPNKSKHFKCQNKNITFNYYSDGIVCANLSFNKLSLDDNSDAKFKLANKLEKNEFNRFSKELDKLNNKLSSKALLEKHCNFMNKIDDKIDQLDGFIRSRKVQILPTIHQKNIIQQWFYDTTCIYNKLVTNFTRIYEKYSKISSTNQILGNYLKRNKEFPLNFQNLRKLKIDEFTKDYYMTPYCIIADTIKEFVSNAKSCVTKLVKNQIDNFNFVHRKTNRVFRSITIESHYTTERGFYPSVDDIFEYFS